MDSTPAVELTEHEAETLSRIQRYMQKHRVKLRGDKDEHSHNAFIFPDGGVIRVDQHNSAARTTGTALRTNIEDSFGMEYYGIARTGCLSGTFYVRTNLPLSKAAEETVIDQAISIGPDSILVELSGRYWEQENALQKRLDKLVVRPCLGLY